MLVVIHLWINIWRWDVRFVHFRLTLKVLTHCLQNGVVLVLNLQDSQSWKHNVNWNHKGCVLGAVWMYMYWEFQRFNNEKKIVAVLITKFLSQTLCRRAIKRSWHLSWDLHRGRSGLWHRQRNRRRRRRRRGRRRRRRRGRGRPRRGRGSEQRSWRWGSWNWGV